MDEARGPLPRSVKIGEPFGRKLWPILHGAKQRFGKGIVIAHPWPRVRRSNAEPVQHGQHRGGLQGGTVVAMQDRACRHCMDALGQGCASGQMRRMVGTVSVMHLKADNLAAVEVEDQIQIEPAPLDLSRQERYVPAPDFSRAGGQLRPSARIPG